MIEPTDHKEILALLKKFSLTPNQGDWISLSKRAKNYGITVHDILVMWDEQNCRCRVCDRKLRLVKDPTNAYYTMVVDHSHKTGTIRGILCPPCNTRLGHMEKIPGSELLAYIDRPSHPGNRSSLRNHTLQDNLKLISYLFENAEVSPKPDTIQPHERERQKLVKELDQNEHCFILEPCDDKHIDTVQSWMNRHGILGEIYSTKVLVKDNGVPHFIKRALVKIKVTDDKKQEFETRFLLTNPNKSLEETI